MKNQGKLPKWVILVAVAGVAAFVILRKKTTPTTSNATELGAQGLSSQSFIPVTGENVAGVGAGYGASQGEGVGALTQLFTSEQEQTQNYMREQKLEQAEIRTQQEQENREARQGEHEYITALIESLKTGGGPPASSGAGTSPAPPTVQPSPPPTPAPPPPAPAASCPSSYPDYNPANGAPGPHSCYKYSRERCSNPQYPYKHVYQDGHVVCSPS